MGVVVGGLGLSKNNSASDIASSNGQGTGGVQTEEEAR